MAVRLLTAGESHGVALIAVLDGIPAGLELRREQVDRELRRRQLGYGRGGRMKIEKDSVELVSGVRHGKTTAGPITLLIRNLDFENWEEVMSVDPPRRPVEKKTSPRPGHGDLAGILKYGFDDARDVLERASARETASRTAAGAVAKRLLEEASATVHSRVTAIGGVRSAPCESVCRQDFLSVDEDPVRCSDSLLSERMVEEIDDASREGDSLGGVFEVAAFGVVPGLGSVSQFDRRLDARLCGAVASIPGVKGVEVGMGFSLGELKGSEAQDEIFSSPAGGIRRNTNRAGGLEAGMTNGEPVLIRAAMKPIPTLSRPLKTVDIETLEASVAFRERADTCAVAAAAVVGEAMVALVLADAFLEKFGMDSMRDFLSALENYLERISAVWKPGDSR